MAKTLRKSENCLNCDRPVTTDFCPHCGQENTDNTVAVQYLLRDAADEFFKFDSKLFTTLKLLVLRPGVLTVEYLAGRRTRYITPLRLYFTVSAFFFLLFTSNHLDELVARATHPPSSGVGAQMPHNGVTYEYIEKFNRWINANNNLLLFLSVPVAALLMKILYLRSRRLYVEHLVFSSHLSAFQFLIGIPGVLFRNPGLINVMWLVSTPIYTVLAFRTVYKQNLIVTILLSVVILVVPYFIVLFTAILLLGALNHFGLYRM